MYFSIETTKQELRVLESALLALGGRSVGSRPVVAPIIKRIAQVRKFGPAHELEFTRQESVTLKRALRDHGGRQSFGNIRPMCEKLHAKIEAAYR